MIDNDTFVSRSSVGNTLHNSSVNCVLPTKMKMMSLQSSELEEGSPRVTASTTTTNNPSSSSRLLLTRRDSRIVSCQESYKLFKRCEDGDSDLLSCDVVVKTFMKCMLTELQDETVQ